MNLDLYRVVGHVSAPSQLRGSVDIIERLTAAAKARRGTLVLPEGDDPRIVEAARRIESDGVAKVIVLSPASIADDERIESYAEAYVGDGSGTVPVSKKPLPLTGQLMYPGAPAEPRSLTGSILLPYDARRDQIER